MIGVVTPLYGAQHVVVLSQQTKTITANGNSGDFSIVGFRNCLILVDIVTVSGTSPTLSILPQLKGPTDGLYYQAGNGFGGTFNGAAQQGVLTLGPNCPNVAGAISGAPGSYPVQLTDTMRILWTVGGTTPNFQINLTVIGER